MRRLSQWSGQQQHLLQRLQALSAQEMQCAQALDKGPWLQMYTVPGNCMPLGWQTTEGSPSWTWQAGGGSFLLLPRRHALRRWLWTFNHNMCENHLEEVQGVATSSLFPPPLFQDTWPHILLFCAEGNAPCQWSLAIVKAKLPTSAAKWQGNDQIDLQLQAARYCHHQIQWATCATWNWGSGPHSEGEKASLVIMDVECSSVAVKTAFDLQIGGKHDPGRPKMTWKQLTERDCREWRLSTLMIEIPGDLVWDLPCAQQASHVRTKPATWKGVHWCGCCLCSCTLIKNPMMMMMTMTSWLNFLQNLSF